MFACKPSNQANGGHGDDEGNILRIRRPLTDLKIRRHNGHDQKRPNPSHRFSQWDSHMSSGAIDQMPDLPAMSEGSSCERRHRQKESDLNGDRMRLREVCFNEHHVDRSIHADGVGEDDAEEVAVGKNDVKGADQKDDRNHRRPGLNRTASAKGECDGPSSPTVNAMLPARDLRSLCAFVGIGAGRLLSGGGVSVKTPPLRPQGPRAIR